VASAETDLSRNGRRRLHDLGPAVEKLPNFLPGPRDGSAHSRQITNQQRVAGRPGGGDPHLSLHAERWVGLDGVDDDVRIQVHHHGGPAPRGSRCRRSHSS